MDLLVVSRRVRASRSARAFVDSQFAQPCFGRGAAGPVLAFCCGGFIANISSNGQPLSTEVRRLFFWAYFGWNILFLVSAFTIIGWAWVAAAWATLELPQYQRLAARDLFYRDRMGDSVADAGVRLRLPAHHFPFPGSLALVCMLVRFSQFRAREAKRAGRQVNAYCLR